MTISHELFHDLFGHGEIGIMFVVIPFKVDTTVEVACTILDDLEHFFLESIINVLKVFVPDVLDSKVIYCKIESDGTSLVFS
jgi:hypothetical protein